MKKLLLVSTVLGCIIFFSFNGLSLFAETSKKDLTFTHQDPDFSITFPSGFERGLADGDMVARFEWANKYRIPNYSIRVYDSMYACGNAPDSELNQLPHEYAEVLKTALPGISELTVFDKEIITLNDGSKGIAWKLKWKWTDNVTYLQSAAVASPREYKVVSCFGTDIYRQDNSLNLMLDQCKKLMFTAP